MTDIRKPGDAVGQVQQARNVLAKWRTSSTGMPWRQVADWTGDVSEIVRSADGNSLGWMNRAANASLIVGTAGNPKLWDAIDALFDMATEFRTYLVPGFEPGPLIRHAENIAAAIIAADERMTS